MQIYREKMCENHETKRLAQPINVQSCDQHPRGTPTTHPQTLMSFPCVTSAPSYIYKS